MALLVIGGSTTKEDEGTVTGTISAHMMEKEEDAVDYKKIGVEGATGKNG